MSVNDQFPEAVSNSVDALFTLAVTQHRSGKIAEAERLYQRVVDSAPQHAPAHHNLGVIAFRHGDLSAALKHYKAATEAQPDREQFWLSYAEAALAANRFEQARDTVLAAIAAGHDTPLIQSLRQKIDDAAAHSGLADAESGIDPSAGPAAYADPLMNLINGGRFADAEQLARRAVSLFPEFGFGWKLLGVAQQVQGGDALPAMRRAAELLPDDPDTHLNLGTVLLDGSQVDAAEQCFRRAVAIDAEIPEAHANLAVVLDRLGRPQDAIDCYLNLVRLTPNDQDARLRLARALKHTGDADAAATAYRQAEALAPLPEDAASQFATVLAELRQFDAAFAYFETALAMRPDNPETHRLFGDARLNSGDLAGAETCYTTALAIDPDLLSARLNLGTCLSRQDRLAEAADCFTHALKLDPESVLALSNLGGTLYRLGRLDEAIDTSRRAIAIEPRTASAHLNLGAALFDSGRISEAGAAYRKALELRPDYAAAHRNIGDVFMEYGDVKQGMAHFSRAMALNERSLEARQSHLFGNHFLPADDSEKAAQLDEARDFGKLVATLATPYAHWPNVGDSERKLKVGLVSGDFCRHPVGVFVEGALREFVDPSIEFFAYYNHFKEDDQTARLQALIPNWRNILNQPDSVVAERVRADGIDILIDLAGHTTRNRLPLFAWRTAPVQASWIGYFATTGLTEIDYFLTDRWVLPAEEEKFFVERPLRLPDSFLCFSPPDLDLDPGESPLESEGHITFGCFNNIAKVNGEVIACWARIMSATAGSRLFLKSRQLASEAVRDGVADRFHEHGIEPDRLILEGQSPRAEYFAAYRRIDLALDPFPYTGGTTTIEALWMGVPTLTLRTASLIGRQGESILRTAGLPEFITDSADAYVERALALARAPRTLAELRTTLRARLLASPLCDSRRYGEALANLLRQAWRERCNEKRASQ